MTVSRAVIFSALIFFMSLGLTMATFIGETAAIMTAGMLVFVGAVTLLLNLSHARR